MTGEPSQRAPYPGLRAFRREETDLFFGREDCINAMVDRLAATRFLSVLGSSGTGKSSLVRTGLLDALELGLMAKAGSRWMIVDFKPGGAPMKNLAHRLLEAQHPEQPDAVAQQDVDLLRAYLARGPRAIVEWCRAGHVPPGGNLLLLVDQFEELFRYQDYAGREEAEAFVALLIESARERDVRVYVTITMRSEYLGACALVEGLSDCINAGMFLTPRMTRENCREAIVGPAAVCNIEIEPALVNRLLNDLANFAPWDDHDTTDQLNRLVRRADQLPLLQYTLNRMWQRARDRSGDARVRLTLQDYESIEGLSGALNAHANQIFEELGKQRANVAEWVFRALTAGSTIADAVRRPTRLDDLVAACGGDESGVRAVVDAFRAPGVNFLMPEYDPDHPRLAPDTYIDISHESLIRQWKKLSGWLEAEGRAAAQWRRLLDRYNTSEMPRGRELANFIAWRDETKPNAAWAKRYGGDYPAVIAHLDKSQSAQNRKRAAMTAGVVGAFVLVTGFGVDATLQRFTITRQSEALEEQRNELQVQLKETQAERNRAESNKRQVLDLLEGVIFNIAVPLTSSERGASPTLLARRASDTAQPQPKQDPGGRPTSAPQEVPIETEPQESGDRTTSAAPEPRPSPALATATMAVETTRRLVKYNPDDLELRRLLVVSLNVFGEVKLQAKELDAAEESFNEALTMLREMLHDSPHMMLWKDDLAASLVGLARAHTRRDAPKEAYKFLIEAVQVERELAAGRPPDRLLQNLQIHLGELGDLDIRLGERREARIIFEERLQVRRRRLAMLPRNSPDNSQRLQDVSVALDRVGQLIREEGDLDGSRKYFDEALKIDRVLYKRNPSRTDWQENLVFSLTRIGDLDRQVGRLREALAPLEEALGLQRKVASLTSTPGPQQTLASLLQRIGDVRRRLKEFAAAIQLHREELALRRKLLERDPVNVTARRNVSSALDYLGNTLRESDDLEGARTAFNEQLKIDRSIAESRPEEVTSLQDLAWSLNRLGDLDRQVNRLPDAARSYEEALTIQRKLIGRDADNPIRMRALALIVSKIGQLRARLSDNTAALTLHREELDLRQKLYDRSDGNSDALRDLSLANDRVGNVLRDMGDLKGALKYFEAELALDRGFAARNPDNLTALGDVQWTLNKISDYVHHRLGDRESARKYTEEMIGIDRRLVDRQQNNKDRHRRLRDDLTKLANLQLEMSQPEAARKTYGEVFLGDQRWLAIARENFTRASNPANSNELAQAYGDAGWHGLLAGHIKEAQAMIESALSINPDTPWNTVNLGHAHLFSGRFEQAMEQYRSVKDRRRDEKRLYAEDIKDDFALFRRLGHIPPDMDRVERELNL